MVFSAHWITCAANKDSSDSFFPIWMLNFPPFLHSLLSLVECWMHVVTEDAFALFPFSQTKHSAFYTSILEPQKFCRCPGLRHLFCREAGILIIKVLQIVLLYLLNYHTFAFNSISVAQFIDCFIYDKSPLHFQDESSLVKVHNLVRFSWPILPHVRQWSVVFF